MEVLEIVAEVFFVIFGVSACATVFFFLAVLVQALNIIAKKQESPLVIQCSVCREEGNAGDLFLIKERGGKKKLCCQSCSEEIKNSRWAKVIYLEEYRKRKMAS